MIVRQNFEQRCFGIWSKESRASSFDLSSDRWIDLPFICHIHQMGFGAHASTSSFFSPIFEFCIIHVYMYYFFNSSILCSSHNFISSISVLLFQFTSSVYRIAVTGFLLNFHQNHTLQFRTIMKVFISKALFRLSVFFNFA